MIQRIKNKFKRKEVDFTNDTWKQNHLIGKQIKKIKMPKVQKVFNQAAAANIIIPFTVWPITSPILMKIGRKLGMKSKVILK